jgi:hypothetical protein
MNKGWYEVRDMFCKVIVEETPIRETHQRFRKSLTLLKHCDHPDALLLSSIIDETDTEEEIYQKLNTHSDPIANVFATMIRPYNRTFYLKQGAKKNHPLSQALLVYWFSVSYDTVKQKHYDLIDMAKKSGDPYAFYVSGFIRKDKKEYAIAFDLGWNGAAKYLFSNRIEEIEIYGKLALRGFCRHFDFLRFWLKTKKRILFLWKVGDKNKLYCE